MKSTRKGPELRKLLNTCEDLQQIRSKMADPELEREARTRLRQKTKRKIDQLDRDLRSYSFRGPLADIVESFPLTPDHFQILAVLLHRHMRCEDPAQEGRLILSAIFESSYDVLARVDLIQPESPLRASGLVVLEDDEESPEDLLEARFVLSEEALEGFRQEISGAQRREKRTRTHEPYTSNREVLVDLRILHNLYKLRSERLFNLDRWNRLHNSSYEPGRAISQRIHACWDRIRQRLELSERGERFPAVRFIREHSLADAELIMVVHLLFKELYEGNAYVDCADLLKLVSGSEGELIQNRSLLGETSPLLQHDILRIEPMLEGRVLTGEAYLADWVVNYVFGAGAPDQDIRPDERIDWHVYLSKLDDSQGFYRDLDAN